MPIKLWGQNINQNKTPKAYTHLTEVKGMDLY